MQAEQHILIAEDDPNDGWLMQRAFTEAKVNLPLHFVHDGQEAINYLSGTPPFEDRSKHPLPALVLLDLKMPRVTGFELLSWVRHQPALARLILFVFSSSNLEEDMRRAYSLGADSYFVKPSDLAGLIEFAQRMQAYLVARTPPPE
jgi:CheY-like chemotaxis protein